MSSNAQCPPIESLLLRGLLWAFVGTVYGFVFTVSAEALRTLLPAPFPPLIAAILAAGLTALVYGSMRLAVIIANILFVGTLLYLLLVGDSGDSPGIAVLTLLGAAIGLAVGAFYGLRDKCSRVCLADGKAIAGLFAGAATVLPAWLAMVLGSTPHGAFPLWLPMLLAPLAGVIYVSTAHWFVARLHQLLPPVGDGALVGGSVGAVTGLLFVVLAGSFDPHFIGGAATADYLQQVHAALGSVIPGCAISCFLLGGARCLLKIRWYDL